MLNCGRTFVTVLVLIILGGQRAARQYGYLSIQTKETCTSHADHLSETIRTGLGLKQHVSETEKEAQTTPIQVNIGPLKNNA